MLVASTALKPAKLTLFRDQATNWVQGNSPHAAVSGRSMNSTGNRKPNAIGKAHKAHAIAARTPFRTIGAASSEPARPPRPLAKRIRFCACCSILSRTATTSNKAVASCAAAVRLSIASQAL